MVLKSVFSAVAAPGEELPRAIQQKMHILSTSVSARNLFPTNDYKPGGGGVERLNVRLKLGLLGEVWVARQIIVRKVVKVV